MVEVFLNSSRIENFNSVIQQGMVLVNKRKFNLNPKVIEYLKTLY
jgi:hypothetical protein